MRGKGNAQRGFTLMEVLLVVVILLMLAGAAVVYLLPQQEGAKKDTTLLKLRDINKALDLYKLKIGHYPTEEEGGLKALMVCPTFENENLKDKWVASLAPGTELTDAWNNELKYEVVDLSMSTEENKNQAPYKLYSMGSDGQPDTADDIQAIQESKEEGGAAGTRI